MFCVVSNQPNVVFRFLNEKLNFGKFSRLIIDIEKSSKYCENKYNVIEDTISDTVSIIFI